jgi:hypothetical protein
MPSGALQSDADVFTDLPPPASSSIVLQHNNSGSSLNDAAATAGEDDNADVASFPLPVRSHSSSSLMTRRPSSQDGGLQMSPLGNSIIGSGGNENPAAAAVVAAGVVTDAPLQQQQAPLPSRSQTPRVSVTTFPFSTPSPRHSPATAANVIPPLGLPRSASISSNERSAAAAAAASLSSPSPDGSASPTDPLLPTAASASPRLQSQPTHQQQQQQLPSSGRRSSAKQPSLGAIAAASVLPPLREQELPSTATSADADIPLTGAALLDS